MIVIPLLAASAALAWTNLEWKIEKSCLQYVCISNGILTVDVPAGVSNVCACAAAVLDLREFAGCTLDISVMAKSAGVDLSSRRSEGFSASVHYPDSEGKCRKYPSTCNREIRPFDWKTVELAVAVGAPPPQLENPARLVLGIHQGSGRAEFDLRSIVARKSAPLCVSGDIDRKIVYPEKVALLPVQRGVMSLGALRNTEKDIDDLHKMGATIVRLQMNGFMSSISVGMRPTIDAWDDWFAGWIGHIDKVLNWLEERNMKMILDMHNPPVERIGSVLSTLSNPQHATRFISAWEYLARRYKGRKGIYGYDLINEPEQMVRSPESCDFWNLQRRAAEAIRKIDPLATVIVESEDCDSPVMYSHLRALEMDNVIYSVHMYKPEWFTHQGCNGQPVPRRGFRFHYPCTSGTRKLCRQDLRKVLSPARQFQNRHNCRMLVGEFSAAIYAPGGAEWLSDCIDIFEEFGWDWTYHSFREARYWNVETVLNDEDSPIPCLDNPRYFVLSSGFKPTLPIEVAKRDIRLLSETESGQCEATVKNMTGVRYRFAAFASVSFCDVNEIGNSVEMCIAWHGVDGKEIRRDSVGFRDYFELGHHYRAFEEKLNVPKGANGSALIVIEAKGRIGEVRVSGMRVSDMRLVQ